jgi:hypothetical protein
MAIYTSELFNNGGLPYRPVEQGAVSSITARVVIPAGVPLLNADVIKFLRLAPGTQIVRTILRNDDLDTNGTPTLSSTGLGFQRTTVDARKAFDATTNPYLTDSIASAVPEAILAAGSVDTALRSPGNTQTLPIVAATTGSVDVAIILDANAATNPATARNIELTVEFVGPQRTLGEFSGLNVYDYQDNSSGI